ncbi:MAG: SDR family NAD(P)-dependent oxidoreductase [Reyranellaceae bacterium]
MSAAAAASSKVAIVTGAARGIGRACALELARRGFDIALVDRLEPEMTTTAEEIVKSGRRTLRYVADVALFARAHEVVADVHRQWGGIDFLLNNAGAPNPKPLLEIGEAEFDRTIAVNLKSCFNYIHAAAPIMLEQDKGGRVVSMSSINALSGGVTSAVSKHAYAAAKAGILGLTRSLAKELGPKISINAICPGVIETELLASLLTGGGRGAELARGIALGRLGTPDDVAQLVAFLATSEPCYLTGQHFVVDGFQWAC